ncbi:MAG: site-2 protease family protein [Phycisphaeraceae bacterium]
MDLLAHTPIALVALIVGFGFLIFVHELGHFLVARAVGIKCTQFAIGFGPSLLTWRKGIGFRVGTTEPEYQKRLSEGAAEASLGETEYRLNYLPLGGYVKMLGQEDMDPTAQSDDPRAFNKKPVWARACVISAGVIMNMIFGLVFLVVAFMAGVQFPAAVVGNVQPDSPAAEAHAEGREDDPAYRGLQVGDRITHIDGDEVSDFMEVRVSTALGTPSTPVAFTIEREGVNQPLVYRMSPRLGDENLLSVGIMPSQSLAVAPAMAGAPSVSPGSPAHDAGVRPGMRIVAVDGQPVANYGQYHRLTQARGATPYEVTYEDPETGETITAPTRNRPVMTKATVDELPVHHLAGLAPAVRISYVKRDSPAEKAGVRAGDFVAAVNDERWPYSALLVDIISSEGSVELTVLRDGQEKSLGTVRPRGGQLGMGLDAYSEPIVAQTLPNTPAAALDLPRGSRVVAIAGQPVSHWADMQHLLAEQARQVDLDADAPLEVSITYELSIAGSPEERRTLVIDAERAAVIADLGWSTTGDIMLEMLRHRVSGSNPLDATVIGAEKTVLFMQQTYLTLRRLIEGWIKIEHLRGPVGIVDEGRQVAAQGWPYLFFFLGLISINLAIINFLPIPIVDGGLMVFLIIEKIKGSPPGPRIQTGAALVGLALIGFVFVTVTFYDIMRLTQ